jgi:hypothetical protein
MAAMAEPEKWVLWSSDDLDFAWKLREKFAVSLWIFLEPLALDFNIDIPVESFNSKKSYNTSKP